MSRNGSELQAAAGRHLVFEIDDTPYPGRRLVASKYDATFAALHSGQCIKCDSSRVVTTAAALKKWLERHSRTDIIVRSVMKMPDGYGRVWMLPKAAPKMADIKGRKIVNIGL